AEPASADRTDAFELAQRGNVCTRFARGLEQGLTFIGTDQLAVDSERPDRHALIPDCPTSAPAVTTCATARCLLAADAPNTHCGKAGACSEPDLGPSVPVRTGWRA